MCCLLTYLVSINLRLRLDVLLRSVLWPSLLTWTVSILSLMWAVGSLWILISRWWFMSGVPGGRRIRLWEIEPISLIGWSVLIRVYRVSVIGGTSLWSLWIFPAVLKGSVWYFFVIGWVSEGGLKGIPLIGRRLSVFSRSALIIWPGVWLVLCRSCREADSRRLLVESQCAVTVLPWKHGWGAAVAGFIWWLAFNGDVWLTPAWIVGL